MIQEIKVNEVKKVYESLAGDWRLTDIYKIKEKGGRARAILIPTHMFRAVLLLIESIILQEECPIWLVKSRLRHTIDTEELEVLLNNLKKLLKEINVRGYEPIVTPGDPSDVELEEELRNLGVLK